MSRFFTDCNYAECRYAECRYVECRGANKLECLCRESFARRAYLGGRLDLT